jgi:hypothetical protein
MRKNFALLFTLLLVACNLHRPFSTQAGSPADKFPSALPLKSKTTETPTNQPCFFNWATHLLPELTKQVQASLDSSGLSGVTVIAEAYGEDCIDPVTNQSVSFSAMETDFRITANVRNLKDSDNLGDLLEKILIVLDEYPAGSTPGQSGYIGVTFESGKDKLNLWFLASDGKAAREKGLHDAELLEQLQKK